MNKAIIRLYLLVLILFATLVGFTSYWTIFKARSFRRSRTTVAR